MLEKQLCLAESSELQSEEHVKFTLAELQSEEHVKFTLAELTCVRSVGI